jgi:hypothetical protein
MPVRRWLVLVGLVVLSLLLSLGTIIWFAAMPAAQRSRGWAVPNAVQVVELVIAYGLLRRAEWGYDWGVRWYLVKAVYFGAVGLGAAVGGAEGRVLAVFAPLSAFYAGLTLFLYRSREFFD